MGKEKNGVIMDLVDKKSARDMQFYVGRQLLDHVPFKGALCKYHTSNDMFPRCKSVHKKATGKSDDELLQHDNKMRNLDTKWKIQKSGKSRIFYDVVQSTTRTPMTTSMLA